MRSLARAAGFLARDHVDVDLQCLYQADCLLLVDLPQPRPVAGGLEDLFRDLVGVPGPLVEPRVAEDLPLHAQRMPSSRRSPRR